MIKFRSIKTTLSKGVTVPSLIFIAGICLLSAIYPKLTENLLNNVKDFIFVNLNYVYVWSITIFVLFLVSLMFSKYGNIRLGRNDSKPAYSFFSCTKQGYLTQGAAKHASPPQEL